MEKLVKPGDFLQFNGCCLKEISSLRTPHRGAHFWRSAYGQNMIARTHETAIVLSVCRPASDKIHDYKFDILLMQTALVVTIYFFTEEKKTIQRCQINHEDPKSR
jgi:hypothetical protein